MARSNPVQGLAWSLNRFFSAMFVVAVMALLYWEFAGPELSDWVGYGQLFDSDGGWLARQGRDPLFVRILHVGRTVFGGNGYATFRGAVYCVFVLCAARTAYAMSPASTWSIFLALGVVAAFLIKGLVQIREGLAFLLLLWPLVSTYGRGRSNPLMVGSFALVASFVHSGASLFFVLWAIAFGLAFFPKIRTWPHLRLVMLVLGVSVGVGIATVIAGIAPTLEFSLQDLGIDTSTEAMSSSAKIAYWIGMGVIAAILMWHLNKAARG